MKLFTLLTAAASLLIVSACASTPATTDERVKVETASAANVQPGLIYVSPEAAEIFTLSDVESEINEIGYLVVRVSGRTAELSALKWAFLGDISYEFGYQFVWFDADGNRIASDVEAIRKTVPRDPVRFSRHAPTEECRNFAMILKMADECDFSAPAEVSDGEAAEAAEKDIETEILEDAETAEAGDAVVPSLPQENVSGDKQDVKTIGVPSSSAPAAIPAEKQ